MATIYSRFCIAAIGGGRARSARPPPARWLEGSLRQSGIGVFGGTERERFTQNEDQTTNHAVEGDCGGVGHPAAVGSGVQSLWPAGGSPDDIRSRSPVGASRLGAAVPQMRCPGEPMLLLIAMKDDQHKFLMLLNQLPARLTAEETAWLLNCQVHDIPALVAAKLIKPLGNPPQNGTKYFATADL